MAILEMPAYGAESQQLTAWLCFPGEPVIHLILNLFQNTAVLKVKQYFKPDVSCKYTSI